MMIITDKRIPFEAIKKLNEYGEVLLFETSDLVYDAISGHPDIFMTVVDNQLIVAPNLPGFIKQKLISNQCKFIEGYEPVGAQFPETTAYNVVCTSKYIFHNFKHTEHRIKEIATNLIPIDVPQAYTRCNLLPLNGNDFITSDPGINKVLNRSGFNALFVNPHDILLQGFSYGFFGGACGVSGNSVFIIGNLDKFMDGHKVRSFLENLNFEIIELYDGPLFDGGSLFFIK